jgi:hypothetical protein
VVRSDRSVIAADPHSIHRILIAPPVRGGAIAGAAPADQPLARTLTEPGLCALEPPSIAPLDLAQIDVERLRHLLWNGHHDKACEALGRIVSWAKDAIVLNESGVEAKASRLVARCTELRSYIENNEGALIDYGQRYRAGKPISTSRAESTVNQLVNARMNKRRQMRWSPQGAHRVLQVRAALLDGRFGHQPIQLAA